MLLCPARMSVTRRTTKRLVLIDRIICLLLFGLVLYALRSVFIGKPAQDTSQIASHNASKSNVTVIEMKYFYFCKELTYLPSPFSDPVALVSFPGSGNTWLRHLLQESTGYLTGSIRKDPYLIKKNFPAEHVEDGSVLVVKMHNIKKYMRSKYRATVLLIRNPMDTILADFHRFYMGPTGTANESMFLSPKIDWTGLAFEKTRNWMHLYITCLNQLHREMYIVFYENLLTDTRSTLQGVLHFLNQTVSKEDLDCAIANGEGFFLRKDKLAFDPYTPSMYKALTQADDQIKSIAKRYMLLHKQPTVMPT